MIFNELKVKNFEEVGKIISEGENCKVKFKTTMTGNLWILGEEETELYLKAFPLDGITISRVYFENTGKGTMTKVLNEIKKYCKDNDLKKIIIESAITKEMISFANKNGFKPVESTVFDSKGLLIGNYELILK